MPRDPKAVRIEVLQRVAYAENYRALCSSCMPKEGLFDTALTNGLLSIVSYEWPSETQTKNGKTLPASLLLDVIDSHGGLEVVNAKCLREGLALTQPVRHGRADDEADEITSVHIDAVGHLDRHPALAIVEKVRVKSRDEYLSFAYYEQANDALPTSSKERLGHPDPEECDNCSRPAFLRSGWDSFGGTITGGICVACGFALSETDARDLAFNYQIQERVSDPTA
jgi:hypothetical protein